MQMEQMRELLQGDEQAPATPVDHNNRPTVPLYQRAVRTNINLPQPVSLLTLTPRHQSGILMKTVASY